MTYEEAIGQIVRMMDDASEEDGSVVLNEFDEEALIVLINAAELQVAKKPEIETDYGRMNFTEYEVYVCPNCESFVAHVTDAKDDEHYQPNNCGGCGQKLLWE